MRWYGTDMVRYSHIGHVDINERRTEERVRHYSSSDSARCSEITAWWTNGTARDHYEAYKASPGHHSAYMEEGIFDLGPTTHVGVVAFEGTGPTDSVYEGVNGTYSGLVFCDQDVSLARDPFAGIAVGDDAVSDLIVADNGGVLESADENLILDIPALALADDTEISISPLNVDSGVGYEFLPDGLAFDEPATATLTIDMEDLDLFDELGNPLDPEEVVPDMILFLVSADGSIEAVDNTEVVSNPETGELEATAEVPHFTSLVGSAGNSYYVYMSSLGTHYVGSAFKRDVTIRYLGFETRTSYQNMSITYKVRSVNVNKIKFDVSGALDIVTPKELTRDDFLNARGEESSTRPRFICNEVGDGTVEVTAEVTAIVEVTFQPENRTRVFTVQQSEKTTRRAKCIARVSLVDEDYYNDGESEEEYVANDTGSEDEEYDEEWEEAI